MLLAKTVGQIAAMKEHQAKTFYEPDNNIVKSLWEENYRFHQFNYLSLWEWLWTLGTAQNHCWVR